MKIVSRFNCRLSSMHTKSFDTKRNRDAHASIRGFMYQAELTVVRWLNLDSKTHLELESGEDIDRISSHILDESSTQERLLEQVKSSSKPITFHTLSLAVALSNFYEHLVTNSGLNLAFRFTTNALPARERLHGKLASPPGIDQWNAMYHARSDSALPSSVAQLRQLLIRPRTPKGANKEAWMRWQNFLAQSTDDAFVAFIRSVELSTGSVQPQALQIDVPEKISTDFKLSVAQASSTYQRLLLFVLRLLTESGPKILKRDDLLDQIKAASSDAATLTTSNFQYVVTLIDGLSGRLAKIERDTQKLAPTSPLLDGGTKTFVPTDIYFGSRLIQTHTFNHCVTIVGRDQLLQDVQAEIDDALAKSELLVIAISAFPAKGKSKVMLEIARRFQERAVIRWVRDGQQIEAPSQAELEDGPVVIFCDDAQKRDDLHVLFKYLQVRKWGSIVCVATRPYGNQVIVEALFRSGLTVDEHLRFKSLSDIDSDLLLPQVRIALGNEYEQFADEVLKLADGSLTVAFVAASLLRKRQLNTFALGLDEEFRGLVMSSYKEELLGSIDQSVATSIHQSLLDVLAVAQPVDFEDPDLETRIAAFLNVKKSELRKSLASLATTGMVVVEHQGVRISPDVLADHVRDGALIANDKPTGFEQEVIDALGQEVLLNIVRNFAELSWQRTYVQKPIVSFETLWQSFTEVFVNQPNYQRLAWLRKLHPVAAFAPLRIFTLQDSILANAGAEREGSPFGWRTTHAAVLNGFAELLAISAHQQENTDEALDRLWKLTTIDLRDEVEFQKTSMQQLSEALTYRRDRSIAMQERAAAALERWARASLWTNAASSPLFIARSILRMSMTESSFNAATRNATMSRVGVHAANTMSIRRRVLDIVGALCLSPSRFVSFEAVEVLLEGLQPPEEQFAHKTSAEEEDQFAEQYRQIITTISQLLHADTAPEILVEIDHRLPSLARRTKLAWKRESMQVLIEKVPDTWESKLMRSIMHILPNGIRFHGSDEDGQKDLAAKDVSTARDLLDRIVDTNLICETISDASNRLKDVQKQVHPIYLVRTLLSEDSAAADSVAAWCVAQPERRTPQIAEWVQAVGEYFRTKSSEAYHEFMILSAGSANTQVRLAIAWLVTSAPEDAKILSEEEYAIAASFAIDTSSAVRAQLVRGLHYVDLRQSATLYSLLLVGDEMDVVSALAQNWEWSTRIPVLPDTTIAKILMQLVTTVSLDESSGDLSSMLSSFAKQSPTIVIDYLHARVVHARSLRDDGASNEHFTRPYTAIPYRGIEGLQEALRNSGQYDAALLRLLADMAGRDQDGSQSSRATVAFGVITQWDQHVEAVARQWISLGQVDKLKTLTEFFRSTLREFTRGNVQFVGDLMACLFERDEQTFAEVGDALISGALRMDAVVRTVGDQDPVNVRLLRDSLQSSKQFQKGANVGAEQFYLRLADEVARALEAERERDARRENELLIQ